MLWYDTANNILKMRSEADDAWIALGTLDQSANTFAPAGVAELTQVQVEDDTSTVFGQVSGQRLGQAVAANTPIPSAGAVGSYAFAQKNVVGAFNAGDTISGSNLRYSSASGFFGTFISVGTWRCMGYARGNTSNGEDETTLWLRIL